MNRNKLEKLDQQQILEYWNDLLPIQRQALMVQIEQVDDSLFKKQQQLLKAGPQHDLGSIEPFLNYTSAGNPEDKAIGNKMIAAGKVGCLLIAGGQGTRLGFHGPKGMFPIFQNKTLFHLFAEKVLETSRRVKKQLHVAIMTSPANDVETRAFFKQENYFGLSPDQITFFVQKQLPFLDIEGKLFLETPDKIAEGPDGNGYSLRYFVEQGVWTAWNQLGIEFVNYVLIDNPLAEPFDAGLIGFHARLHADMTIKGTRRLNAQEKVGLVTQQNKLVRVIEYSEMPEDERQATNNDGSLKHQFANLSLYCFSMPFIKEVSKHSLPLHPAFKIAKYLSSEKTTIQPQKSNAWKFETFIFDVLPFATSVQALLYPREECFAPLKNLTGPDSVETVRDILEKHIHHRDHRDY